MNYSFKIIEPRFKKIYRILLILILFIFFIVFFGKIIFDLINYIPSQFRKNDFIIFLYVVCIFFFTYSIFDFVLYYIIGSYKTIGTLIVNEEEQKITIISHNFKKEIDIKKIKEIKIKIGINAFTKSFSGHYSYIINLYTSEEINPILLHITNNCFIQNKIVWKRLWNKRLDLLDVLEKNNIKLNHSKKIKESQIRNYKFEDN
jgi:hypothetical protein